MLWKKDMKIKSVKLKILIKKEKTNCTYTQEVTKQSIKIENSIKNFMDIFTKISSKFSNILENYIV